MLLVMLGPPPGMIPIGIQSLDPNQQQMHYNYEQSQPPPDSSVYVKALNDCDDEDKDDRYQSHGNTFWSRSPRKRRRSHSRSRDRRCRSRSRDRQGRSRSHDHEKEKTKEKERKRRRKGLPPMQEKHLSVCTTTLWLGHLTKHTTEEDIRTEIEKYGTVNSVNLIPPRGCAYIDYARRKDSYKARDKLDGGIRINGNILKVSWAQGIGVKNQDYKDMWNVDHGVTYIPWSKLPSDLNQLCSGGMIDEDTLPDHLKGMKFGQSEDESYAVIPQIDQHNVTIPMDVKLQYSQLMPGVVPVLPQMGVMPPMIMSMPGPISHIHMPPQHICLTSGPPSAMSGLSGIGGVPPTSQPALPSSVFDVSTAISSANPQLNQAIQSILTTSVTSGHQTQPSSAAAAIVSRPGVTPKARFQVFNSRFNSLASNIRLSVVGQQRMMPAGLTPQFVSSSQNIPASSMHRAVDEIDESMDIQDTDERSLSNPEIKTTAQPPNFAMSMPSAPSDPVIRGQVTCPVLIAHHHGIGIPMQPKLQMNMVEQPRMVITGDIRSSVPETAARLQGSTSLIQTIPEGMRSFMPRGMPGSGPGPSVHRPELLGLRLGFGSLPPHFGSTQGQCFRGPRPYFRPDGSLVKGFCPLVEIETIYRNPNDPDMNGPSDNPPAPEIFGRRDFDRLDDDLEGMGNPPCRFMAGYGRSTDIVRDRVFGRDPGIYDGNICEHILKNDRNYDTELDRYRLLQPDYDRDKVRARELDRVQEPRVTKSCDRSGKQSRWSEGPAASESDLLEKSSIDLNIADINLASYLVPSTSEPSQIINESETQNDSLITTSTLEALVSVETLSVAIASSDNNMSSTEVTASEEKKTSSCKSFYCQK